VPAPAAPVGESTYVTSNYVVEASAGAACALADAELIMRELVRTTDAVLISVIEALLNGACINHLVVDQNMSVLEGSIGVFPRRILVGEDELQMARRLLEDAGFGHELRPDKR
jgi:Putative prokaryotic signal transducing protein